MFSLGQIKGFCPKTCNLTLSSNFFVKVMQKPGPVLPYGKVPGAPHSDGFFFGRHLYLAERCCKNPQRARGPAQCKSGQGNNHG